MGPHAGPEGESTLVRRFVSLWEAGAEVPDYREYLAQYPETSTRERLAVILVDLDFRRRRGLRPRIGDYLSACPELRDQPEAIARLEREQTRAWELRGGCETSPWQEEPTQVDETIPPREAVAEATEAATRALVGSDGDAMATFPLVSGLLSLADAAELGLTASTVSSPGVGIEPGLPDGTGIQSPRFEIEGRLGAGGMGVVFRAFDRERGETVALKTMRQVDPTALYRFKNEFRTLADLTHPNLAKLYELIAIKDLWFFTMELVEGVDFITFVRASSPPGDLDLTAVALTQGGARPGPDTASSPRGALGPERQDRLRRVMQQLAEGVHSLHEAGKLHRDIKPSNVLVTPEGRVVLLDFGLAADLERSGSLSNRDRLVVGTASYMSPEQAGGLAVSTRSDWYSVGVMLYEALTGKRPHEGRPTEVLRMKSAVDPPHPGTLVEGIAEDLAELCMALLRRDPEGRPSGREVLAALASAPAWPRTVNPTAHLIGRASHLESLHSALERVRDGEAVVLMVHGRSGSGKSTLLQSFLDSVGIARDATVLMGRCHERESVPYKALDSLLDALSEHLSRLPAADVRALLPEDVAILARLFPVLRQVEAIAEAPRPLFESPDQFELRRRASAALRELLARMSRRRALVLTIDDLQWGDLDSAILLLDLMRPPHTPPLLFVGSYRSEDAERSPFLRAIRALGEGTDGSLSRRDLAVDALTHAESRELARDLLGRDHAAVDVIARESHGNPLFIYELVEYVQGGAGVTETSFLAGRIELQAVLWARIRTLPAGPRQLLETVAVSGRPITQALAIQAAGLGPEGSAAVAELRGPRLIRVTGPSTRDDMEVYHDQIRETIVRYLSPDALRERHHDLARTLAATPHPDLELLAVHLEGAGDCGRASEYYARSADQAAQALAFDHAARLYRKAIELRGEVEPGANEPLWASLGDALANAGRGAEAADAYSAAARTANSAQALEYRRRATMQLLISGHVDRGLESLGIALRSLGMTLPGTPRRALLSVLVRRTLLRLRGLRFRPRDESQIAAEELTRIDLCWSAVAGLSIIDPIMGADFQARGLLRALRAGEPYRIARSLAMEAAHVSTAGGPAVRRFEQILAVAQPLAESVQQPHARAMITLARGLAKLMLGEWKDARDWLDRGEDLFRNQCTGVAWELDTIHNLCLWALVHLGDLDTLRIRWPALLEEARERGDLYAATTLSTYYMTILRLAQGDDRGAERELEAVMANWTQRGFHIQHSTAFRARFHILLYRGEAERAWRAVCEVWPLYSRSMLLRLQMTRIHMQEIRARSALALVAGSSDPGSHWRQAEADVRRLGRERRPWADAYASLYLATMAWQRGHHAEALAGLEEAATRFDGCHMRLNAAVARCRLGELKGGSEGEILIRDAIRLLEGVGISEPHRWVAMYAPGFTGTSGAGS